MDGRPNRRNKATFSNFSGLLWKGPELMETLLSHFIIHVELAAGLTASVLTALGKRVWKQISTKI